MRRVAAVLVLALFVGCTDRDGAEPEATPLPAPPTADPVPSAPAPTTPAPDGVAVEVSVKGEAGKQVPGNWSLRVETPDAPAREHPIDAAALATQEIRLRLQVPAEGAELLVLNEGAWVGKTGLLPDKCDGATLHVVVSIADAKSVAFSPSCTSEATP